jgi:hypothetical protein
MDAVLMMAVGIVGCRANTSSSVSGSDAAISCQAPIAEYCRGSCDPYDIAVSKTRETAKSLRAFCRAGTGTCGDYRWIALGNGFVFSREYYEAGGGLVAAETSSDDIDPICRGDRRFGIAMSCERVATEGFCPPEGPNGPPLQPPTSGR